MKPFFCNYSGPTTLIMLLFWQGRRARNWYSDLQLDISICTSYLQQYKEGEEKSSLVRLCTFHVLYNYKITKLQTDIVLLVVGHTNCKLSRYFFILSRVEFLWSSAISGCWVKTPFFSLFSLDTSASSNRIIKDIVSTPHN